MLANYVKLALTVLGRRKFFTFISLFGISLTLVVLMVAVALLDNVFAPRAPESKFDRVLAVRLIGMFGPAGGRTAPPGYLFVDKYVRGLPAAEEVSIASEQSPLILYHAGQRIETHLRRTDGAYWRILEFDFIEGVPFTDADNENANFVAVITEAIRAKLFGGAAAVGRVLEADGQRFRIVGVVRTVPFTRLVGFSEIWAPIRTMKTREYERQMIGSFNGIVLARSRADFPLLRQQFEQRLTRFEFDDPKAFNRIEAGLDTPFEAIARSLFGVDKGYAAAGQLRTVLVILALLFITLPTMNLVSINLSRIMERASEIGIRKAFGASSRSLVGQFIVENVVLTVLGGVIGFALSALALAALSRAEIIPYAEFDLNLRIFFYGVLLAVGFGIVSGVYPAWRMSRLQPVAALRGGAK